MHGLLHDMTGFGCQASKQNLPGTAEDDTSLHGRGDQPDHETKECLSPEIHLQPELPLSQQTT